MSGAVADFPQARIIRVFPRRTRATADKAKPKGKRK